MQNNRFKKRLVITLLISFGILAVGGYFLTDVYNRSFDIPGPSLLGEWVSNDFETDTKLDPEFSYYGDTLRVFSESGEIRFRQTTKAGDKLLTTEGDLERLTNELFRFNNKMFYFGENPKGRPVDSLTNAEELRFREMLIKVRSKRLMIRRATAPADSLRDSLTVFYKRID